MKKIIFLVLLCFVSASALAKKATYVYTDNRFNFVKIEEIDKKEIETMAPTHPFTISEEAVRAILKEVKLSRSAVIKKEVETQDIFDDHAVNFLAAKLVDAFDRATAKDKIVVSFLTKDPKFILRDDKLTILNMWITGSELHMSFEKLMAKLTGDYDKRGDFTKIVARARGLRVSLEVRDGQKYGANTDELVIDTTYDFKKATIVTTATVAPVAGSKTVAAVSTVEKPKTTKERLQELENLKQDGLITEKEYKQKKKDILKGL